MQCIKERSLLTFINEEGRKVRYDLKDGKMYSQTKKELGTDKFHEVKSITYFFAHIDVDDIDFVNEKYKEFINYISRREYNCYSIGTFLKRLKKYSLVENYILLNLNCDPDISKPTNFYQKDILKFFIRNEIKVSYGVEKMFIKNYDVATNICRRLRDKYEEDDKLYINRFLSYVGSYDFFNRVLRLIELGYTERLIVDTLYYYYRFEAIDSISSSLVLLRDYANMQHQMTRKYKKNPKYIRSVHDIVSSNYNTFKKEYSEEIYKNTIDLNLEYKDRFFSIVYPKTTDEIKQEGVELHHCVASYIDKCVEGNTRILFLRDNKDLYKSLVTIEIKNDKITQARGEYNRSLCKKERDFLNKYCKIKKLEGVN